MDSITLPSISLFNKSKKMTGGTTKQYADKKTKNKVVDLTSEISTESNDSSSSEFVPNVVSTSSSIAPNIMKGGKYESIIKNINSSDESSVFNEIYLKSRGTKSMNGGKKSKKQESSTESSVYINNSKDSETSNDNDNNDESELLSNDSSDSGNFKPDDLDNTTSKDGE